MSPRDAERIVAAALVWNQARAHRLAVGQLKRRADQAGTGSQQVAASRLLTLSKRRELAAARALARLCPPARVDLPMADVVVTLEAEGIPPVASRKPLP